MSHKTFVIDTNVLIHNPGSLYSFSDNTIVIPMTVIEELDTLKTAHDKKGKHAREVLREIDRIYKKGALSSEGAKLKNGGRLKIALIETLKNFPLDLTKKDNQIIAIAYYLHSLGEDVFFISKDTNARIKATALGIKSNDFEKEKVDYNALYKGWSEINIEDKDLALFFEKNTLTLPKITLNDNEYVHFITPSTIPDQPPALGRYSAAKNAILPLKTHYEAMNIKPLNMEQRFAFDLLLNDDVSLATLIGQAGTGKTLIAIACALQRVIGKNPCYEKMLVARPIMPLGKDIGYLPGNKDQKLTYWMQPIFDNLEFIFQKDTHEDAMDKRTSKSRDKVSYLLDAGIMEIEAITYIRGRSIPNQIMIIDEAQNLTPHEVKTIVSRVGEGTKIILTGDPEQIDNPYLDANSNGLSYIAEKLKNNAITGHVLLSKSERSKLAALAAELL